MSFFPSGYEPPKTGGKWINGKSLRPGDNRIRAVSPAVVGFEAWVTEGKDRHPVRRRVGPDGSPSPAYKPGDYDHGDKIKPFAAFVAIDRADGQIRIAQFNQVSIIGPIQSLADSEDWGNPADHATGYDLIIKKSGNGMDTEYEVLPAPKKALTPQEIELVRATPVNLEAIFSNEDPFGEPAPKPPATTQTGLVRITEVKTADVGGQVRFGVFTSGDPQINGTPLGTFSTALGNTARAIAADGGMAKVVYARDGNRLQLIEITKVEPAMAGGGLPDNGEDIPFASGWRDV